MQSFMVKGEQHQIRLMEFDDVEAISETGIDREMASIIIEMYNAGVKLYCGSKVSNGECMEVLMQPLFIAQLHYNKYCLLEHDTYIRLNGVNPKQAYFDALVYIM